MPTDRPKSDSPVAASRPDALFDAVYQRLKNLAGRKLRENRNGTLDTTELVHELYVRLSAQRDLSFQNAGQFFAYSARAMRSLLADRSRERLRLRSGGQWVRTTLSNGADRVVLDTAERMVALESALSRLEQADARAAHVVELRYFTGLSLEQVAETLQLARRTVDRDWCFARAFLKVEFATPG